MLWRLRSQRGVTSPEIVTVMLAIGLLIGVGMFVFAGARNDAKVTDMTTNINRVSITVGEWASRQGIGMASNSPSRFAAISSAAVGQRSLQIARVAERSPALDSADGYKATLGFSNDPVPARALPTVLEDGEVSVRVVVPHSTSLHIPEKFVVSQCMARYFKSGEALCASATVEVSGSGTGKFTRTLYRRSVTQVSSGDDLTVIASGADWPKHPDP